MWISTREHLHKRPAQVLSFNDTDIEGTVLLSCSEMLALSAVPEIFIQKHQRPGGCICKFVIFLFKPVQDNLPGPCQIYNESRPVYYTVADIPVIDTDSVTYHHFPGCIQTVWKDMQVLAHNWRWWTWKPHEKQSSCCPPYHIQQKCFARRLQTVIDSSDFCKLVCSTSIILDNNLVAWFLIAKLSISD